MTTTTPDRRPGLAAAWPPSRVRVLTCLRVALNSAPPIPADRCRSDRCRVQAGSVARSRGMPVRALTTRAMPTTTGSATWERPGPRRTQLPEPAPPPVPGPPGRRPFAVLSLALALSRRQLPGRRLTLHCRHGQAGQGDGPPGRPGVSRRQKPARAPGSPSAGGPGQAARRPSAALRMPSRRWTTRCRAPALRERDRSGRTQSVSTVPLVLPPGRPAPHRGRMTIGPCGQGATGWGEMAGLARCRPVPLLGGASDRTEGGAPSPAWRTARALRAHPPPVRRGRPPRYSTEPMTLRSRVLLRAPPRRRGGSGGAPRFVRSGLRFR